MSIDSVGSHSLADSPPEFRVLADLISVLADPEVSKRRLQAIADGLKDIEEARRALDAERAAHSGKVAEDRAALDAERKSAVARWADAMDAERAVEAKRERVERHAAKVGFFEPASFVPVGPSGMTRARYVDPDPQLDPHFEGEIAERGAPLEHFAGATLTREPEVGSVKRGRGAARRVELDQ